MYCLGEVSNNSHKKIKVLSDWIAGYNCQANGDFLNQIFKVKLMPKKSTTVFLVSVIIWEIVVAFLYGFLIRYAQPTFTTMQSPSTPYLYNWATSPTTSTLALTNTTQIPYPYIVVAIAIILLLVGFAMIAGYIEKVSATGMAFTILIFALTTQNFFIYRDFWDRSGANDPNASRTFQARYYSKINFSNQGNSLQTSYSYTSASFLDAVGCAIAMYVGYSAVIGRIGLGEIFFLSWIGPFVYEINSQLLWRFFWPDTGYPSRAFAFGSVLGIISSLILGKKNLTDKNPNYSSKYRVMGLGLLGVIFVWCSFPILLMETTYETTTGNSIVAMQGQVNIWMALAASVLGVFTACSIYYQKFSVHELVFTSLTGGIAYSSTSAIDYNTGGAIAIGFLAGFLCSLCQIAFKKQINKSGVVESNSVIFSYLMPSFFAAICSAVTQGISNTTVTVGAINSSGATTITYNKLVQNGRSETAQGGYQILAWLLSIGFGAIAGVLIGLIYSLINDYDEPNQMFNDAVLYNYPKSDNEESYATNNQAGTTQGNYPSQPVKQHSNGKPFSLEFDVAQY